MRPRPAWCWPKRGVRTREERVLTPDEQARAKQEAESSVAPHLLEQVRLAGRLVSGDALSCQRALCHQIRCAGGDYLFAVKENQPSLLDDITLLFRDPPPGERFVQARTVSKHSGRLEERQVRASAALATYLRAAGWVDVGLVLEVETLVRWPAQPARPVRAERRYFLTSLPPTTTAATALQAVRRHWHIENRLHWPRDVVLGEDACRVRTGHAPHVLAAVRNCVVGRLHRHHVSNLAAAVRTYAWSPPAALLSLLGLAPPDH
jgi:predicted transposase YbfD/YdcC